VEVEGVVTREQGAICNQRVVSWGFKWRQRQGNTDEDYLLPTHAGHRGFSLGLFFSSEFSAINIDDTLPVPISVSGVCPLRFC